ncbi:MAG TPA: hypothetical protein EYP28_00400 [Methanophagales archaeon]|nr:hypothetical protein [Methanophagales archaeon]
MADQDFYYKEYATLREELLNLKNCQVTFLTFSVTATALLLGLIAKPGTFSSGLLSLSPLLLLLPSWWIFLDKATTITRIVGYFRILEKMILEQYKAGWFSGWENALTRFRQLQSEGELKLPDHLREKRKVGYLLKLAILRTTHPYWVITWYTFFGLSVLCLALSLHSLKGAGRELLLVAIIMVGLSAIYNAHVVLRLIYGRNSYTANEHFWKVILQIQEVDDQEG